MTPALAFAMVVEMEISEYVRKAIDDWERAELEPAMLHTLAAVDGTAVKSYRDVAGSRDRFVRLIDEHLWLVEPMLAVGINLETTKFGWVPLKKRESRFSEVIYEVFRSNLAHGAPIPKGSGVALRFSDKVRAAKFAPGMIELPDTAIFALLAVVVFARANASQRIGGSYFLTHDEERFVVDEWWGREDDARPYFAQALAKLPRVTMDF